MRLGVLASRADRSGRGGDARQRDRHVREKSDGSGRRGIQAASGVALVVARGLWLEAFANGSSDREVWAASSLEAGGEMGLAALHADREETAARARAADVTDRFRPTRLILDAGHRLANGAGRRPVSAVAGSGVAVGNGGGRRSRAAGRGDYARSGAAPASRSFGLRRRPVHAARGRPGRATDPAQGWFYPDSADVPPRRVQSDR